MESVFHVHGDDTVRIIQRKGDDTKYFFAVMTDAVARLARAVNDAKRAHSDSSVAGGAFVINEFGQVLVPVNKGLDEEGERYYVGDCSGAMVFRRNSATFSLDDTEGMSLGDAWTLPYVGIPYNLSKDDTIYFKNQQGSDTILERPHIQDEELVSALRRLRPHSDREHEAVRFVVNPHGIVLTKVPTITKKGGGGVLNWLGRIFGSSTASEETWQPTYVGRINYDKWFQKEDGRGPGHGAD